MSGMSRVEVNKRGDIFPLAVIVNRIGIMCGIQKQFFDMELGQISFHGKKECRKESISCLEACSKRGKTGMSLWDRKPHTCRGGSRKNNISCGNPIPSYSLAVNTDVCMYRKRSHFPRIFVGTVHGTTGK